MKKLLVIIGGLLLCPQLSAMQGSVQEAKALNRITVKNDSGEAQFIAFNAGQWSTDLDKLEGKLLDAKEEFILPEKTGIAIIPTSQGVFQISLSESTRPLKEPRAFALGQVKAGSKGGLFNHISKRLSPYFAHASVTIEKGGSVTFE